MNMCMYKQGDQIIVSRIAASGNGRNYLEVDGKPFLMGYVQNCGGQQLLGNSAQEPYDFPLSVDWLENCFEKTKALGYRTISLITKWNEIEPTSEGAYTFELIEKYIQWAVKYDLRIDIAWFGSNACGGARLRGYGRGWASWIPEYLQDRGRYFGNGINRYEADSEVMCPWLPDGGPHHAEAAHLFQCERNAVYALFNYLSETDLSHRIISFQLFNEPNCHNEWHSKKDIWLTLINNLGKAVKTSGYVAVTRVNMARDVIDGDISRLANVDLVGCDAYMGNVAGIREALSSGTSKIPHIAENYGNLPNTSTLAVTALVHGGFYCPWQLNDHWEDIGMYEKPSETYTAWTLGVLPDMRESGRDIAALNSAVGKIQAIIATAAIKDMQCFNTETDTPEKHYAMCYNDIGFRCEDASVGMTIRQGNAVYCVSDTSNSVYFVFVNQPLYARTGGFNEDGGWHIDRNVDIIETAGQYTAECRAGECLKVDFQER